MRICTITIVLVAMATLKTCPLTAQAQVPLYASKQSGEFTHTNGQVTKVTDSFERGTVVLTNTGPIKYAIDGGGLVIAPAQTKTWKGKIYPDLSTLPAPGKSAPATLFGDYDVTYSRPQGSGTSGMVISTYECGEQGCPFHQGAKGVHEMVNKKGQEKYEFIVHSVDCRFPKTTYLCYTDPVNITATGYPAGGTYEWTSSSSNIELKNTNSPTVTVSFKGPAWGDEDIQCKYTTNGVTYKAAGIVDTRLPANRKLNRVPTAFTASSRADLAVWIALQYVVQCLKFWSYFYDYSYDFLHAGDIIASDPVISSNMDNWYLSKAQALLYSGQQSAAYNESNQWKISNNNLLHTALNESTYKVTGNARVVCKANGDITVKFDVRWTITDEIDWNSYSQTKKNWHWSLLLENALDILGDKILDCEYDFSTTYDEKVYVDFKK